MPATKWDLTKIYKTREEFLREEKDLEKAMKKYAPYEGKLGNEEDFASYIAFHRDFMLRLYKLDGYVSQKADLDQRDIESKNDLALVNNMEAKLNEITSFIDPELLSLPKEYFATFFKNHPECQDYDFDIEVLFANKDHVLDGEKEKLLSYSSPIRGTGRELYGTLSVADFKPKEITLSTGEKVKVTTSNWLVLIDESKDANDRKAIFEALYSWFEEHKNTYGEIYNNVVQTELSEMKERGYSSILASHLDPQKIPLGVFETLVKVASEHTEPLKKYVSLRAKYLPLDEYHTYERTMQFTSSDKKYSYEEARKYFFDSIAWYPKDYQIKAESVISDGYVDVYEGEGKRSGAYSTGGEATHPFILLNFQGTLDDIFTLVHESGHSVHTMYSMEAQPFFKSHYRIFVAEIASTFNEHNLLDHLMTSTSLDLDQKIMLLQKAIDEICATFYRQTVFAHYEFNIAKKAEAGEPLNYDTFNKEMIDLYKQYYGLDITKEKLKSYVWAYIPHLFYTPFYVYQYSTSFTASMAFYESVKNKEEGAWDRYLSLLKMGGSDYPVNEVKKAGVDLTEEKPYLAVIERMEALVDELEMLLKEKYGK